MNPRIASVAIPVPLRQTFDFLVPEHFQTPCVGARVLVPFGRQQRIGVIMELKQSSDYPTNKLKDIVELIDRESLFDDGLWVTLKWLSHYYLAPIGEVIEAALPVALRQLKPAQPASSKSWSLSDYARSAPISELNRAPLQLAIVKKFQSQSSLVPEDFRDSSSGWRQAIKALIEKNWVVESQSVPKLHSHASGLDTTLTLSQEQQQATESISASLEKNSFSCILLHGITGSGKTAVYFNAMSKILQQGKQVLLLVPEIGLTPQLFERIEQHLPYPVVAMHSKRSDSERHIAWWHTQQGNAQIVVGTRSAVFANFNNLGLVVVDEEHDVSFKQQEGVRYHARDVAIYRAKQHDIPIVLASATPALETLVNAKQGRYQKIDLLERATKMPLPSIELIDLNQQAASDGLSPGMLAAIKSTLSSNKQVMLFLNRRGFAPVIYCADCKKSCQCHRCDSNLTLHRHANQMRCHHCGYQGRKIERCMHCSSSNLAEVGEGTQRVEDALSLRFPQARVLRIDRDSTSRKGALSEALRQVHDGEVDIVLGTQLIAKGHDFENLAMVGVLEADAGIYSTDFRASETLFQQLVQVSGRAGRHQQGGRVFIQTRFPEHSFFQFLQAHDFNSFAAAQIEQRLGAGFPPFGFFALLRAESTHQSKALQFLKRAREFLLPNEDLLVLDAVPAPMARRAGRYRAQLLLSSSKRSALNNCLQFWLSHLGENADAKKLANSVRWSIDIDPMDFY